MASSADLLDFRIPEGRVTVAGIRENLSAALRYLDSRLRGVGAAAIDGLMEDAATAEISRSQLWQWIQQGALTDDGLPVVRERVEWLLDEVLAAQPRSEGDRFDEAADLLREMVLGEAFPAFLTTGAYARHLVEAGPAAR